MIGYALPAALRLRRLVAIALAGLIFAATTGCSTTAKLNSFAELSKVGVAYADTANAVITQAAEGSIAADTATLLVAREDASPQARLRGLTAQSEALRTQLGLFSDIRRHQSLVKEYFVTLGALANAGDADSAIGTAASGTISALGKLSPTFNGLKVGQQPLADFAAQAAPLVVASLRAGALERELRTNGATINHELVVSEGLMAFLADKIKADDAAVQGPQEAQAVFIPYTDDGPLPGDWPARRAAFLQRAADLTSVSAAQDAARKLRLALASAAEDHLAPGQLQLLASDLSNLVDVLEKIKRGP
jgi:hypothetical protein